MGFWVILSLCSEKWAKNLHLVRGSSLEESSNHVCPVTTFFSQFFSAKIRATPEQPDGRPLFCKYAGFKSFPHGK